MTHLNADGYRNRGPQAGATPRRKDRDGYRDKMLRWATRYLEMEPGYPSDTWISLSEFAREAGLDFGSLSHAVAKVRAGE